MPIWAMEDTGLEIEDLTPFWGVVSPEMANRPGLSSLQRPEFYLPAGQVNLADNWEMAADDSVAGADAPFQALNAIYYSNGGTYSGAPDYLMGIGNGLIAEKWSELGEYVEL